MPTQSPEPGPGAGAPAGKKEVLHEQARCVKGVNEDLVVRPIPHTANRVDARPTKRRDRSVAGTSPPRASKRILQVCRTDVPVGRRPQQKPPGGDNGEGSRV